LSAPHREVLTLRFVDELSYEEISEIVGCSLGTVRSRLHYAKKILHRDLLERNND
jgi:RNA polymerase sigma-70 factor (ECF subfamily)